MSFCSHHDTEYLDHCVGNTAVDVRIMHFLPSMKCVLTRVAEEMKAAADEARPIPPYDVDAERPDDVYALHDIIPESEFNAISVQAITKGL